jgi:hypothetical protein
MSVGAWIRAQRDRPISDSERRVAFTLVVVVATVGTLLLAIAVPGAPSPRTATRRHASALPAAPTSAVLAVSSAAEERAAREFLNSYLAYIYGRARAGEVRAAAPAFTHALLARPSRVPPSMRARHPRIVALQIAKAPAGALGVTAIINDGGLVNYPVALLLARHGHRLLVSGLAGA